jgi:hypothetical protein
MFIGTVFWTESAGLESFFCPAKNRASLDFEISSSSVQNVIAWCRIVGTGDDQLLIFELYRGCEVLRSPFPVVKSHEVNGERLSQAFRDGMRARIHTIEAKPTAFPNEPDIRMVLLPSIFSISFVFHWNGTKVYTYAQRLCAS